MRFVAFSLLFHSALIGLAIWAKPTSLGRYGFQETAPTTSHSTQRYDSLIVEMEKPSETKVARKSKLSTPHTDQIKTSLATPMILPPSANIADPLANPADEQEALHAEEAPAEESQSEYSSAADLPEFGRYSASGDHGDEPIYDVRERYMRDLVRFFESRKTYPVQARLQRQTGRVEVGFTLDRDGRISDVKLVKLSPYDALNMAAIRLVKDARSFRPIPRELKVRNWQLSLPIEYQIASGVN